jgi:cytochrome c-type biogenesis protein
MREIVIAWYGLLNSVFMALGGPLRSMVPESGGSIFVAVLLGLLGATSPCQLSTNTSAIAYLGAGVSGQNRQRWWMTSAYIAGKVLVYSSAGLLAVFLGQGLAGVAIPTVTTARKALGPLMILIGLSMLGVWKPRLAFGQNMSLALRGRAGRGVLGAFLLGVAFSFAFCPTLGLLFFGYVVPMAIVSAAGPMYPAAFALGTTFPLLLMASVLSAVSTDRLERRLVTWEPWFRRAAGVIFLLTGVNDTLLYWFL